MAKAKYFNKGTVKGTVTKSDIVEYDGKNGKKGGSFLSMEVSTSNGNRIKGTVFPSKANPNKHNELHDQYPVGAKVEVSGNLQEKEYTSTTGKKGIDRSLSISKVGVLQTDAKELATFIVQGDVQKIRETDNGVEITVEVDTSYEKDEAGKKTKVEQSEIYTLAGNEETISLIKEVDLEKGSNAKFKGQFLNKLEFDDYGDVIDSVQMFLVEKIEDVVDKNDIEDPEELPFQ